MKIIGLMAIGWLNGEKVSYVRNKNSRQEQCYNTIANVVNFINVINGLMKPPNLKQTNKQKL